MKPTTVRGMTVAVLAVAATSGAAQGQDGIPPVQLDYANGATLRFYGQINKGVLSYDDGRDSEIYYLIDNDNSGTRVGLQYTQPIGNWTFENVNEFSYAPYSTNDINIVDNSPSSSDFELDSDNIRKIDFTLADDRAGKFWLGQGSMATDGTLEVDLSGTGVIAYSGVADSASAQIIRLSGSGLSFDDSLSGILIGDAYANLDGDRRVRVRYDTPSFAGFTLAAAYGRNLLSDDSDIRDENLVDASVNYAGTYNAIEVAAALGYYWQEDTASVWGGSASALHTPTGVNLTVSAGTEDANDATYWYTKLGLLREFFAIGDTAVSIDYYSGDDFVIDDDLGIDSSTSNSWGIAYVQNIDRANTELWLTYRSYDYGDNTASYDDGTAVFGGARFRF